MQINCLLKKVFLGIIAASVMSGCAGTPDKNPVNHTRRSYEKLKKDTLVVYHAPKALDQAQKAVNKFEHATATGHDKSDSDQLKKLANGRIAIARETAELKATQHKMQRISKKLQAAQDTVRQIERERMEAGLAHMPIRRRLGYLQYFRSHDTERGILLRFKRLNFTLEKSYLKSSDEAPINELARFLKDYPNRRVMIEGYTDNTGAKKYNQELSLKRAEAVRKALISRGVMAARMEAVGLGEQSPIASNKTKAGRRQNRRVDIIISGKNGEIRARGQHK